MLTVDDADAARTTPFSVRFPPDVDRALTEEAKRARRSKGAIVISLTDEALRCRRFPGIAFRGDDARRRAWVIGSGLDVWEIVQMVAEYPNEATLIAATQLTARHLRLAEAYRAAHSEEIAELVAQNTRLAGDLARMYPFVEFQT